MKIPNKPKGMKDPVLLAGQWEERAPQPPTMGTSKVDLKKLHPVHDKEDIDALKNIPYRKADKSK